VRLPLTESKAGNDPQFAKCNVKEPVHIGQAEEP